MLNQFICVGRLSEQPKIQKTENGKELCIITIVVPRSYKNEEGIYENDFLNVVLLNYIANSTIEYCKKGDIIGIKGRIETRLNDKNQKTTEIIAEKVTFLSSAKKDKEEN